MFKIAFGLVDFSLMKFALNSVFLSCKEKRSFHWNVGKIKYHSEQNYGNINKIRLSKAHKTDINFFKKISSKFLNSDKKVKDCQIKNPFFHTKHTPFSNLL